LGCVVCLVLCGVWCVCFCPFVLCGTGLDELSGLRDGAEPEVTTMWRAFHLLASLLMGLCVTAYRALATPEETLVEVFE